MAMKSQSRADALPAIQSRKGQFQMVPDFLQQKKKEVFQDQMNLNEMDMMTQAFEKQDLNN